MVVMEEFQLLTLHQEDETVSETEDGPVAGGSQRQKKPKVAARRRSPGGIANGPPVEEANRRASLTDEGSSLESLHFNTRRAKLPPLSQRWYMAPAAKIMALVLLALLAGFLLGYVAHTPTAQPPPHPHWRDRIRFTPDFARCPKEYGFERPAVLVHSFDGLASRFLSRLPSLSALGSAGLRAAHLRPVFPTSTFPNHYSLATGLYPESHGIIDNTFSSPDNRRIFVNWNDSRLESSWWAGQPIWQVAQRQGRRVFAHNWPGTDVQINGVRPVVWSAFDMQESVGSRAQRVVGFLRLPKGERPDLVLSYFHQPDSVGHFRLVDSGEFAGALQQVDQLTEEIMQGLANASLLDCVDVVFLSDHGIAQCQHNADPRVARVDPLDVYQGNGFMNRVRLKPTADLRKILSSYTCNSENSPFQIYAKEDLPVRLHYVNAETIAPLIIMANLSYILFPEASNITCEKRHNMHGWDNLYDHLQAVFLAYGPSFKTQTTVEAFANIEVFNLLVDLLEIDGAENNGTSGSLRHLLRAGGKLRPLGEEAGYRAPEEVPAGTKGTVNPVCGGSCSVSATWPSLDATSEDRADFEALHGLAWGVPRHRQDLHVELLVNRNYVLGFCRERGLPLWSGFRLPAVSGKDLVHRFVNDVIGECRYSDPRAPTWNLTGYCTGVPKFVLGLLVPPEISPAEMYRDETLLVSNTLPLYQQFYHGIWHRFLEMIADWNSVERRLMVWLGPVWDHQPPFGIADDLDDTNPVPSHLFAIVLREREWNASCDGVSCQHDVISFIIPHRLPAAKPCQSEPGYIASHTATVRDVELISGLRFFARLPGTEAARLRTRLPDLAWWQSLRDGSP